MIPATILLGVILRLLNIGTADLATDEAQFMLGASAAQPPLGMAFFRLALSLHDAIIAARLVSVLAGFLGIWLLYIIARRTLDRRGAAFVAAVGMIVPSHILFSKLAYLDALLITSWLLVVLAFERARVSQENGIDLALLWAVTILSTFIKTQALLLPALLLCIRLWEMRRTRPWRDPVAGMLALSLLPILVYILTSIDILATLQQNTGSTYGIQNILQRILILFETWWASLLLFLPAIALSIPSLKRFGWPVSALCLIAVLQGLLLGPGHPYYTGALVVFALPVGALFASLPRFYQGTGLLLLFGAALALHLRPPDTYWNTHADMLNALLSGEEHIIAVGPTGHHVRWYLEPEVLVGNAMDLSAWEGFILDLGTDKTLPPMDVVYADDRVRLLRPPSLP